MSVATSYKERFNALDLVRQEHDLLVMEGKSVRSELDAANKQVGQLKTELADLGEAEAKLKAPAARGRGAGGHSIARSPCCVPLLDAAKELAGQAEVPSPRPYWTRQHWPVLSKAALTARSELGSAQAERQAAANELKKAKEARAKSSSLSGAEDCPLCGQPLGDAFASVQAHRQVELEAAEARLATCEQAFADATRSGRGGPGDAQAGGRTRSASLARLKPLRRRPGRLVRRGRSVWPRPSTPSPRATGLWLVAIGPSGDVKKLAKALDDATKALAAARRAADEASRLQGRLERRPQAELALADAAERSATAGSLVETLRSKVKALGFDQAALAKALQASRDAEQAAGEVDRDRPGPPAS